MAVCVAGKIDSNSTGFSFAEEACLKSLPGENGFAGTPTWFGLEPNTYPDFGPKTTTQARKPITNNRQNLKGNLTSVAVGAGYNTDLTSHNTTRLMQGFMFGDARQKVNTAPYSGNAIAITAVDGAAHTFAAAAGLTFIAGALVLVSGFPAAANNGLKELSAATGTLLTTTGLVTDAAPPASAKIETVGFQFVAGDCDIVVSGNIVSMTSTTQDFTAIGALIPGEWIFIGGDAAGSAFINNAPGFARILSIAAHTIVFDDVTWSNPVTENETTQAIQIFFGTVIRTENNPALIKRRSYQLERTLGLDANGTQSEYEIGSVPNDFTLNIKSEAIITADFSFIGLDSQYRNGTTGVKPGTRVAAIGEQAFNSSSDVYRLKMNILDATTSIPTALFGFITDSTLTIKNNVTGVPAIGVTGSFDTTAGNIDIGGTFTAYFSTVAAVQAIRNNSDVGVNIILTQQNGGIIYDVPLLGLGGGPIKVEKDKAITVPLTIDGAKSALYGHSLLMNHFPYLPNVGMSS